MLIIALPEDVSDPECSVFARRVSVSRTTRRCQEPEASYQSTRTSIPQRGREPVPAGAFTLRAHQVRNMSCDTRRSASDILPYASPGTLVATSCPREGSKDGSSSFLVADSALLSCRFGNCAFGRPACVRRVQLRSEHPNRRHHDPSLQGPGTASGRR